MSMRQIAFALVSLVLALTAGLSIFYYGMNQLNATVLVLFAVLLVLLKIAKRVDMRSVALLALCIPLVGLPWLGRLGIPIGEKLMPVLVMTMLIVGLVHCTDIARRLTEGD